MELTKFGALVQFALELERGAAAFYQEAERQAQGEALRSALGVALSDARKSGQRLERIRRQDVNEMLLETIHGIHTEGYVLPEAADARPLAAVAGEIEKTLERYYTDIAAKLSLRDAARSFSRLAESHALRGARLGELGLR